MGITDVRVRILGKDDNSIDEVVNPHQLRWLEHVLRKPNHCVPRRALLSDIGIDWIKSRSAETKISHRSMKSLTIELSSC